MTHRPAIGLLALLLLGGSSSGQLPQPDADDGGIRLPPGFAPSWWWTIS